MKRVKDLLLLLAMMFGAIAMYSCAGDSDRDGDSEFDGAWNLKGSYLYISNGVVYNATIEDGDVLVYDLSKPVGKIKKGELVVKEDTTTFEIDVVEKGDETVDVLKLDGASYGVYRYTGKVIPKQVYKKNENKFDSGVEQDNDDYNDRYDYPYYED